MNLKTLKHTSEWHAVKQFALQQIESELKALRSPNSPRDRDQFAKGIIYVLEKLVKAVEDDSTQQPQKEG